MNTTFQKIQPILHLALLLVSYCTLVQGKCKAEDKKCGDEVQEHTIILDNANFTGYQPIIHPATTDQDCKTYASVYLPPPSFGGYTDKFNDTSKDFFELVVFARCHYQEFTILYLTADEFNEDSSRPYLWFSKEKHRFDNYFKVEMEAYFRTACSQQSPLCSMSCNSLSSIDEIYNYYNTEKAWSYYQNGHFVPSWNQGHALCCQSIQ